jgi:hypothetical protein
MVMLKRRIVVSLSAGTLLLLVFNPSIGSAQTTASISGTVYDATGGILPAADIVITHTDTGVTRHAIADNDGRYRVTNLYIGQYDVSASMQGFRTVTRRGIVLTIGRDAIVDVTLSLGDLAESVTVTGDAPLVDTRSGALGAIVDRDTILEIPLSGRDLTGLITLQAGVTLATTSAGGASPGANQGFSNKFSIDGSRAHDNSILLDGTEVKSFDGGVPAGVSGNFLGGEAIQEFKIERNSYSAEFGGTSGGVVNVVSKSGGNEFHGSVYAFTRNAAMDAANFRAPAIVDESGRFIGKEKPPFWRAQYGASAGGRIIRNRTFYFANFEGMRERLEFPDFVTTLSADARRGVLPRGTVQVSPAVVPYLDLWPLPSDAIDLGDGTARYPVIQKRPTDEDFYQLRIDHNFSSADTVFGRVTRQVSERFDPEEISRWGGTTQVYNTFATIEHKKILSTRLLHTFRFGYNRRGLATFSSEDPGVDPALFMVPPDKWLFPMGAEPIMGTLSISGVTSVGLGRGWVDRSTNRFQFVSNGVYSRGANTLKFGLDWTHMRMVGDNPSRPGGELSFGSIEAFLRGRPRQFRGDVLPETDWNRHLLWNTIGSYVQYDWQVHARATVNLGLRHEFYTVATERDGKYANLRDPLNDTEITVLGTRGDPWWENPSFLNFAPRVGLSWDPTGSGTTAVRAGGGVFHNLIQPEAFPQFAWRTAPFGLETNIQAAEGVIPFPVGLYDYIVGLGQAQADMFIFPFDDAGNPRRVQWNVNVQRQLFNNIAVMVGYAGARGLEETTRFALNAAQTEVIDGHYVFPTGARRPNPAFNSNLLSNTTRGVTSWYHGLQLEVQRRFQAGWQLQVAYSRTKSLDLASGYTPTATMYVHAPHLSRGLSAFHSGQRLTASGVWQLPGQGREGWIGTLLGGWQLGGILNLSEGNPHSITMGARAALAALGLAGDRPDLVPGGDNNPVIGDPDRYFDASQFAFPAARAIGDVGRNTLIGPGIATLDLGLTKNVAFGTRRLQLRAEVFNLFNRTNLGTPATLVFNASGVPTAGAGFISSTSTTARQVQLGVRLEW